MKKKLVLLLFAIFLLSGCSVEYNIDITDRKITLDGVLLETDESNWNKVIIQNDDEKIDHNVDPNYCMDGSCGIQDGAMDTSSLTYSQLVDLKTIDPDAKIEGLTRIKDVGRLGISAKKTIDYKDKKSLKELPGVSTCYKYFSVLENKNKDGILLSTSNKNLCFESYDILEEITVKLTTNHEVESHNADEVNGNDYIWKINRENYNNKNIQINLLNKTQKKMDLSLLIFVGSVILVIIGVGGVITLNMVIKSNRANTIK